MVARANQIPAASLVLWHLIEVHFDELEFALEHFERRLDDALRTLDDLARFPQSLIDAHVDALMIGGAPVLDRVIAPALLEAESPARSAAAALVVIATRRFELLWQALASDNAVARHAIARAATVSPTSALDAWVHDKLSRRQDAIPRSGLLELCAARQLPPPNLLESLQSDNADLVAAAVRAARHGDAKTYLPVLERLTSHEDSTVRDAACLLTLAWGSQHGWQLYERAARESANADRLARYAALGGRRHHALLRARLAKGESTTALLFALGFSGNAAIVPELAAHLRSSNEREAKLAAQSISLITGLDLESKELRVDPAPSNSAAAARLAADEADRTLPALEDDDLDADLVPQPEDLLPDFDLVALERHCQKLELDPARRWLGGAVFGAETLLDYFKHSPLRRHHVLADALGVMTRGAVWFDSRAGAASQRSQLATLRARGLGPIFHTYKAW